MGVSASDPDGDSLTYDWSVTGGTINDIHAQNINWTTPSTYGNYTISVTVSDGKGGEDSESVDIYVHFLYDFLTEAPGAYWISGAGGPLWNVGLSDNRGFACYRTNIKLEDGNTYSKVLETHPQWVNDGWISGAHPNLSNTITIPDGAKFTAKVGFIKGATAIAMSIQGKINSFIAQINKEVEELLPYSLKIKWIAPEISEQAFIKKNRVIILLSHHKNQDENFSKATMLYINKAVIPQTRPHIHFKLGEAIDLMMTKRGLYSFIKVRSSFSYFVTEIMRPKIEGDPEIKEFCTVIDALDERGLFTRVLLRELKELGYMRAGVTETGDTVFETGEFTKFLNKE